jgi:class 3 adenylate cyclase
MKEISVIFADIRGYTSLSENMHPRAVMHMINDYLKIMCDALWDEMGTLTAFQGDALMAIFNAPLPQDDHPLRAVRAALKMRAAVLKHQSERREKFPVLFGFGINTGWATVGNVGAQGRLQNYTALGDVINVASRLQSNATDNEIFITDATYRRVVPYVHVSQPFNLTVKGRTTPLVVGRLLGLA